MRRQRGETWGCQEIVHFLSLFGELGVQEQLNAQHHNQAVYEELARRMNENGYNRTAYQLRTKAKDLKKQYRHMKTSQPGQGHSFWRYCHLLDSAFHKAYATEPKAATSSTIEMGEKPTEGLQNESQPTDPQYYDKSQGPPKPCSSFRASRRLLGASLGAHAMRSSIAGAFSRRNLQHLPASATVNLAKRRFKKSWSTEFSKTFIQYCKNMKKSQQVFEDHMAMERQEREKIQRETSRSRKEIKAAASQMREAILVQAEATNKAAEAINRYNDLLECFILGPDPQRGGKETLQDNSGTGGGKQLLLPQFS